MYRPNPRSLAALQTHNEPSSIAPPAAEWGLILNDLRQNLFDTPELALIPAIVILITSVGFNVLGDGLRDLLDVRSESIR